MRPVSVSSASSWAGVDVSAAATTWPRGTITAEAGRLRNSIAPDSRRCCGSWINPRAREASIRRASSLAVPAIISSSRWGTCSSPRMAPAARLSTAITGRITFTNQLMGTASTSSARSALASEMRLGTSSPNTPCSSTTTTSASTKPTTRAGPAASTRPDSDSSQRPMAGSATAPRPSEAMVTPTCTPAM